MYKVKIIEPPEKRLNEIHIFVDHVQFLYNTVLDIEKQLNDIKFVLAQYHHNCSIKETTNGTTP